MTISYFGMGPADRPWFVRYLESELNTLLELPERWDGGRAARATVPAIESAVLVSAVMMDGASAPPQLFPLPDGGIQIEWHVGGDAIEIEIDGAGEVHVLAETAAGDEIVNEGAEPTDADPSLRAARDYLAGMSARLARTDANA